MSAKHWYNIVCKIPRYLILIYFEITRIQALVGMEACYNSFIACANQVLLLCASSVRSIGVRNWDERLDLFVSQSKYEDAICLGLLMFEGKARAMQGLKGNALQRKLMIKTKVLCFDIHVLVFNVMVFEQHLV